MVKRSSSYEVASAREVNLPAVLAIYSHLLLFSFPLLLELPSSFHPRLARLLLLVSCISLLPSRIRDDFVEAACSSLVLAIRLLYIIHTAHPRGIRNGMFKRIELFCHIDRKKFIISNEKMYTVQGKLPERAISSTIDLAALSLEIL